MSGDMAFAGCADKHPAESPTWLNAEGSESKESVQHGLLYGLPGSVRRAVAGSVVTA